MEPRIQYAKTEDGVSIAFCVAGSGPPLVLAPDPVMTHVQRMWEGAFPYFYQPLARSFRLVWYDSRGSGLSDRKAIDLSMDAMVRDLEAVVDRVGLEKFALCSWNLGALSAATYAATHPERVSHLILIDGATNWYHFYEERPPIAEFELALREKDMFLYTETLARVIMPFNDVEKAREWAEHIRACVEPEAFWAACAASPAYDVSALTPRIRAATLVMNSRNYPFIPIQAGQRLAARIADARFVILDDLVGDYERRVPVFIQDFAEGDVVETGAAPAATAPSGFATILFTDMESSTALRRKLGDAKVQELVRAHNEIVRAALGEHAGREIKHTGDGIMASFSTATSALECSIVIQRGVASHVEEHPDVPLGVYIGLNAGEPIAEEQDLFGTSVDLARRICDHAEPGQILASNVVRELAEGKGFLFGDIGDVVPKGFEEPVRLYEVRWRVEDSLGREEA